MMDFSTGTASSSPISTTSPRSSTGRTLSTSATSPASTQSPTSAMSPNSSMTPTSAATLSTISASRLEFNSPITPASASAASVLQYLTQLNMYSEDFAEKLDSTLRSDEFPGFVSELRGYQPLLLLDFLDRALDVVSENSDLRRRCLRSLRKSCGLTRQLPSSHLIGNGLVKTDNSPVASGGFADVYIGSYHDHKVAIKSLRIYSVDNVAALRKTFCKEVIIWKRLSHENILPFLGVTTSASELCMVSEWMDNGNIVQHLNSHPEINRLQLLLDIANGLKYLHSEEVVHGDLKGHNVLINRDSRAILADFGLASITSDPLSINASTPGNEGTVRWMAPELLNPNLPENETARRTLASDVYAFAMVAIEVFSGNVPFLGYRDEVAVYRMLNGIRPLRPGNSLEFGLTDEVWDTICRCWHGNPDERPNMPEIVDFFDGAVSSSLHVYVVAPSLYSQSSREFSAPVSHASSSFGSVASSLRSLRNQPSILETGSMPPRFHSIEYGSTLLPRPPSSPQESYYSFIQDIELASRDGPSVTSSRNSSKLRSDGRSYTPESFLYTTDRPDPLWPTDGTRIHSQQSLTTPPVVVSDRSEESKPPTNGLGFSSSLPHQQHFRGRSRRVHGTPRSVTQSHRPEQSVPILDSKPTKKKSKPDLGSHPLYHPGFFLEDPDSDIDSPSPPPHTFLNQPICQPAHLPRLGALETTSTPEFSLAAPGHKGRQSLTGDRILAMQSTPDLLQKFPAVEGSPSPRKMQPLVASPTVDLSPGPSNEDLEHVEASPVLQSPTPPQTPTDVAQNLLSISPGTQEIQRPADSTDMPPLPLLHAEKSESIHSQKGSRSGTSPVSKDEHLKKASRWERFIRRLKSIRYIIRECRCI